MKKQHFETQNKVAFAALSKRNFFLREHIIKFILEQGYTPTCAFMMFSYFLLDTVDRKELIRANNDLIRRSDELWVFDEISDGVEAEINLAKELGQTVKYFKSCKDCQDFTQIPEPETIKWHPSPTTEGWGIAVSKMSLRSKSARYH